MRASPARSQGSEATQPSPGASSHSSVLGEDAGVPSSIANTSPDGKDLEASIGAPCAVVCSG